MAGVIVHEDVVYPILVEQVTEHFTWREIVCHHCGRVRISTLLHEHMAALEDVRIAFDEPINVMSGWRCKEHNAAIGGAPLSWHLQFATDLQPDFERAIEKNVGRLRDLCIEHGFNGVGWYHNPRTGLYRIHVDRRATPTRWTKIG